MRGNRVVGSATGFAVLLAGVWLALPRLGSDLSAQVARADFFAAHGFALVDLRWYAGIQPFGYSLVSPPLMATLGVRPTGALALVGSAAAFAALLVWTGVPRPLLGSLVGVLTITGNLVSGRVTYALGVAFGLVALLALTLPTADAPAGTPPADRSARRTPDPGGRRTAGPGGPQAADPGRRRAAGPGASRVAGPGWRRVRPVLVVLGALAASATSPVAGLFVGLVGAALLVDRRYADGLLLGGAAAVPLAVTGLLFGEGGWMNISRTDTLRSVTVSLLVAALVAYRPVRVAAVLAAAGVLAAALVHTPVGLNATRLVTMFALPVLAAAARPPGWLTARLPRRAGPGSGDTTPPVPPTGATTPTGATDLPLPPATPSVPLATPSVPPTDAASGSGQVPGTGRAGRARGWWTGAVALTALLAVVCWWLPPVVAADLRSADDPTADRSYFAPLAAELGRRGLTGRVEVPPTRNYWEAAQLGEVPLARGWLRQVDIGRNPLFFTTVPGASGTGVPLTADSYRAWLDEYAVQYVAVPDAPLSWVGRAEAELVGAGLPYLTEVWSDRHWRLYAVTDPTPLVAPPGVLVRQDAATLTLRTTAAAQVLIRIRHTRWLTASPPATITPDGPWTLLTVPTPGTWTLTTTAASPR
ncbi:hypothetical protein [Micromonospora sp. WMMD714]|uniref:hypothetical protein n=1 Tax=Micromonospora sp. WMMD714 TaxID=3016097 RepID=UPI00249A8BB5|nr:hypothetical protein [Micromonospora sp. WMMD714]WFE67169.1 hypothetical protein O7625_29485 [Micromonospora sp. WMMD714]